MMTNPNDPYGKLLVISGRNDSELKTAALAVALGSKALSGATALIDRLDPVPVRIPYDAPNWLPADRPVKLGELVDAQHRGKSSFPCACHRTCTNGATVAPRSSSSIATRRSSSRPTRPCWCTSTTT